ncbi:unnamed protein product [Heterobilharzia americana]|nr:unnamed protein product [Heterobilharzia americana]
MNSFFTSPSRIFESVNAKTGHLVSDLNQKLDISGKLDSIKQASVGTLEQVVRGSSVSRSDSKDTSQKSETLEDASKKSNFDQDVNDSTRNSFSYSPSSDKSKVNFDRPEATKSSANVQFPLNQESQRSEESNTSQTGSGLRRQSTQSTPRPPRPPPPSTAALSRAMSLDETNLSAQIKASGPSGNKGQPVDEQSDDQKTKHSRRDVTAFKTNEESRILQQPSAPVIEEEENSSASEYGENGDQPIYRHESDLPITTRDQPDIGLKLFEAPKAEQLKKRSFPLLDHVQHFLMRLV